MKTLRRFLAVGACAALSFPGFAFAASTVTLGAANDFSILSKTSVLASSSTQTLGSIGAGGTAPKSAITDMEAAYNDGIARSGATATGKAAGNIGELNFLPGLYKWNTPVSISSDITLPGGAEDAWIFQVLGGDLDVGPNVKIILTDGALAKNIFWAVAGNVTIGANSVFNGNILSQGKITLKPGATLHGKALSQNDVLLGENVIVKPDVSSVLPPPSAPVSTTTPDTTTPPPPSPAATTTAPDTTSNEALQNQINDLLAIVQALTAQLQSAGVSPKPAPSKEFSQDLFLGSKGDEVSALQLFLISRHIGPSTDALASVGATGNFGPLTKQALIEFQKSAGITPASGYFGPKTRAYINAI